MAIAQLIIVALAITSSSFTSIIDAFVFVAPLLAPIVHAIFPYFFPSRLRGYSIYVYRNGNMPPINVSSPRQLADIVQQLLPVFEGNESEHNWSHRENAVKKLQQLTLGDAPHRYPRAYVAVMRTALDSILKAVNSLRTTLSTSGCELVQDIATSAGSGWTGGIDPAMVDILLQNLIRLCSSTKSLAVENGNATILTILRNVSYSGRILHNIWNACEHKNEKPRAYASGWLNALFTKHGHHKNVLEHAGGLELIEKCIKKGLGDASPGVREGMRGTFWAFAQLWPEKSKLIMSALDGKQRGLLEKHPDNPNPPTDNPVTETKPVRSLIKDTIAAHKNAKTIEKAIPLHPHSAQPDEITMPPLDAKKQQGTLAKHPVAKHPVAKHPDQPKLANDDQMTVIESIHPSLKGMSSDAHKNAKGTGTGLPLRPRSAQPNEIIMPPLDAKQQGTLTKHPVVKHPVAKHPDQPKLTNDDPITVIESIHPSLKGTSSDAHIPTHAPAKEEPTTKAIGEDLPRPQSAYQATVEEESSIDDLFIEKPEPSPSEDAKPVSNPQLKEDSIFGEKRAKEAAQNPQVEQLPKDVKRLLVGPRRRPRKPVVKSAEDVCFIKPKKTRAKVPAEVPEVRVRPRPVLESPKPVRVDSSNWGWRKCLHKGETQRALTGLLCQRLDLDDDALSTVKLEDDLEIATDMCKTQEAVCAVLEFLEGEKWEVTPEGKNNVAGLKATTLYVLAYLMRRRVREVKGGKQPFTDKQATSLAMLAQAGIRHESVEVRAAAINYCTHLYAATTTSQFWKISEDDEPLEALVWYHLKKENGKST